ncbi:hypothetical protein NPIL_22051 [Nephila pilipes]|uniref:Uncharacterized protein n=1 Tax=Nephila pilipes TaxID=299642 RepID=A0A8X6N101_NEPPI|nr:hypothetical protein NPIL_22051 [Nephila pilipes]
MKTCLDSGCGIDSKNRIETSLMPMKMVLRIPAKLKSQRLPQQVRSRTRSILWVKERGSVAEGETRATVAGYVKDASELVQGHCFCSLPLFFLLEGDKEVGH